MKIALSHRLLNAASSLKLLLAAAAALLLLMLGGRDLWTQEWRWASICWQMLHSGDYLHPYLIDHAYYDKPLLSYWLMLATSKLTGGLSRYALRLPSALAGMTAVYALYQLGQYLFDRTTGLLAGWMLLTTYYFVFWSRVASADMLNVAGILLSLAWYWTHRDRPNFKSYTVFFLLLSLTSLCKGLVGAVVPLLAVLPDMLKDGRWKQHLHCRLALAILPALCIYAAPFWASTHLGNQHYAGNGLYEVYRENIVRYFHPFDHKGPFYTYFIFLPIYLLPWTLFFVPALAALPKRWQALPWSTRWVSWSLLIVFVFLTLSGSRRNYYALPLVPFATLLTAEWVTSTAQHSRRLKWAGRVAASALVFWLLNFCVLQPLYYYGGAQLFAQRLHARATQQLPWHAWQIMALATPSKLNFYLDPAQSIQFLTLPKANAQQLEYSEADAIAQFVKNKSIMASFKARHTILITRARYVDNLKPYFKEYQLVTEPTMLGDRWAGTPTENAVAAFIPRL